MHCTARLRLGECSGSIVNRDMHPCRCTNMLFTGEHMDEFEGFETKAFVGRLLGKGDWTGFMDKIKVSVHLTDAPLQEQRFSYSGCQLSQLTDVVVMLLFSTTLMQGVLHAIAHNLTLGCA